MTQLTFSSNFYRKICFKFCILEQIIAAVLFICISSINNKRSLLIFQSTTAPTYRGWSACALTLPWWRLWTNNNIGDCPFLLVIGNSLMNWQENALLHVSYEAVSRSCRRSWWNFQGYINRKLFVRKLEIIFYKTPGKLLRSEQLK